MVRVLIALLAAAALAPVAPAAASDIVVRREPGLDATQRADVRADADARLVDRLSLPDTEVVRVPGGRLAEAARAQRDCPRVRYAEADGRVHATAIGLDPMFQWDLSKVHATEAWGLST